jgi:hypothetical protein
MLSAIVIALFTCVACGKKDNNDPKNNGTGSNDTHTKGAKLTIEVGGVKKEINGLTISGGSSGSSTQSFIAVGYQDAGNVYSLTMELAFANENPVAKQYTLTDNQFTLGPNNAYIYLRTGGRPGKEYRSKSGTIKIHRFANQSQKVYLELDGIFDETQNSGNEIITENVKISGYIKGD